MAARSGVARETDRPERLTGSQRRWLHSFIRERYQTSADDKQDYIPKVLAEFKVENENSLISHY